MNGLRRLSSDQRICTGDFVGARIEDCYQDPSTLCLLIEGADGRRYHVAVMADAEGNGPGALHVSNGDLKTFLGILGGD
jgi:hypothetical protein